MSGEQDHVKPKFNDSGLASARYDSESRYADNHETGELLSQFSGDSVPSKLSCTNGSTSLNNVTQHQSSSGFPTGTEEQHCHGNNSIAMGVHAQEPTGMHTDGSEIDSASDSSEIDLTDSESELVGQMKEVTLKVSKKAELHKRLKIQIKEKKDVIRKLQEEKDETERRYQEETKRLKEKAKEDESTLEYMKSGSAILEKSLQAKEKEIENLRKSLKQFEESTERMHLRFNVLQQQIKELTEQLKEEKVKNHEKELELLRLKNELLHKELAMKEKDNYYKDKVRIAEGERDAIKVEFAEEKRKQEKDKRCKLEKENQRLVEKLRLLENQNNI